MALPKLSRFINIRTYSSLNNDSIKVLYTVQQNATYSTNAKIINELSTEVQPKPKRKVSKAMKAYLDRAKQYDEFMKKEIAEYNIGKRHLANMMGEDPENFNQADIDRAISYLFPSGIYDRLARPMMKHPEEIFTIRKAAEFDETGRPYHFLFYTGRPNYYMAIHNIMDQFEKLNQLEDTKLAKGILPRSDEKMNLIGSTWLTAIEFEKLFLEPMGDTYYEYIIKTLERLTEHPLSFHASSVINLYRKNISSQLQEEDNLPLQYDSKGRPFVEVTACMRKTSRGTVIVRGEGSGKITINGAAITYFNDVQCQEQLTFVDHEESNTTRSISSCLLHDFNKRYYQRLRKKTIR